MTIAQRGSRLVWTYCAILRWGSSLVTFFVLDDIQTDSVLLAADLFLYKTSEEQIKRALSLVLHLNLYYCSYLQIENCNVVGLNKQNRVQTFW